MYLLGDTVEQSSLTGAVTFLLVSICLLQNMLWQSNSPSITEIGNCLVQVFAEQASLFTHEITEVRKRYHRMVDGHMFLVESVN